MKHLERGGWLIWLVAPVVILVLQLSADGLGIPHHIGSGASFIITGALLFILSRAVPGLRTGLIRAWCAIIAVSGLLLFLWPSLFGKPRTVVQPASLLEQRLNGTTAAGMNPLAESKAAAYRALILEFEKGEIPLRVLVDLDAPEATQVKQASLYVQSEPLRLYDVDRKHALTEMLIHRLQSDFSQATCNVAVRGSAQWTFQASARRGQILTITSTTDEPRF